MAKPKINNYQGGAGGMTQGTYLDDEQQGYSGGSGSSSPFGLGSGGSLENDVDTTQTVSEAASQADNPYDLLRQQNYEALLSKEIQLENARMRALKHTNANLGALGMQSSGYGQTATSGIESQYLQALENANQTYQEEQRNIDTEEIEYNERKEQERAQQQLNDMGLVGEKLSIAESQEEIDRIMELYGLYTKDFEGNNVFNYAKAVELYGEQNAKELRYLYENGVRGLQEQVYQGTPVAANDWHSAISTFVDQNGKTGTMNDELERFFSKDLYDFERRTGYTPANGDVVKISQNSSENAATMYLIYLNGNWYQTTATQYANASSKHWFRSAANTSNYFYWDDGKKFFWYKDWF